MIGRDHFDDAGCCDFEIESRFLWQSRFPLKRTPFEKVSLKSIERVERDRQEAEVGKAGEFWAIELAIELVENGGTVDRLIRF